MVEFPQNEAAYFTQIHRQLEKIYPKLVEMYPDASCALTFNSPFQLLVATILSAQCTDIRVNAVTPALFNKFPHPELMATAQIEELEQLIRSAGFYHNKARNLLKMSIMLVEKFEGQVPKTMAELLELPGVARKTANVVLGNAFHLNEGIPVDTHVKRLAGRLGLSRHETPEKIEQDLMRISPREEWHMVSHYLIWHGRNICQARKPLCNECPLLSDCPTGSNSQVKCN